MSRIKIPRLSTALNFSLSFILLAIVGAILLALPICHLPDSHHRFFDHFITSVSLVSVSGMAALPIGITYNLLGQIICLILIQIGGLGVVTFVNLGLYTLHQRISLRDQYMLQEVFSRESNANFGSFLLLIYKFTFLIEMIGMLILMLDFVPRFGWGWGAFNALFISVSSFSNSGFVNFGSQSLEAFYNNPLVLLTVATQIIVGGIGFIVWFELRERFMMYLESRPRHLRLAFTKLSVHTKLVLTTTAILLVMGTLLTFAFEINNPRSMVTMTAGEQFLNSFFKSVNARTAGYTAINYQELLPITKFISMLFTIIGGAPGGTAGGIKVTTLAIIFLLMRSELNGYHDVVVYQRTIPNRVIKKAIMIALFFTIMLAFGYAALLASHPHVNGMDLLFEAANALGTSGISLDTTQYLNDFGKSIIVILMLAGRIGPITLIIGLLKHNKRPIDYAEATIHLG